MSDVPGKRMPFREFQAGLIEIWPLGLGVLVYGFAFGVLTVQADMTLLQTGMMGAFVFAGASQIVAVERLVTDGAVLSGIVAGSVLNLRFLLLTASLCSELGGRPFWQIALGVHMTGDESWALMLSRKNQGQAVGYWYLVGGGCNLMLCWLASTMAGNSFSSFIADPMAWGLDFAFTAVFIALLRTFWKGRAVSLRPWMVSVAVVMGLQWLGLESSWTLMAGGVAGAAVAGCHV
ncbi:AzlC family ABC transporter permease [Kiloniella sp. b19]|uniref:AzlC family ABC transporter permease n=1 Tax=Kiloniella sp. GXU_MW_B19 TaxID=3141326 RepID=UPI0031DA290A